MTDNFEETEKNLYSTEFNRFFRKNVKESLIKLEKRRIRLLIISFLIILFTIIFLSAAIYNLYGINFQPDNIRVLLIIPVISLLIIIYLVSSYKCAVKNNTLEKLLFFIGDFKVEKNNFNADYVKNLKLFDKFNDYYCDDRIKGKYGLLNVDIQEIELKKGTGRYKHTVFKGILIKIPYHKRIEGYTVIQRNSKKIHNNITIENRDNINFEFNEYYNVFSNSQLDAKCIITDSFMEKMVRFAKHNIGGNISISFEEGNINIAIATEKDWFDVPFFKSATNISNYRAIILEVITLLKIIDSLKLEPKIGF